LATLTKRPGATDERDAVPFLIFLPFSTCLSALLDYIPCVAQRNFMCRGCVPPQTVKWLQGSAAALPPVDTALAFAHIPVPEFINGWNSGTSDGRKGEAVCCPSCNSGLLEVLRCACRSPCVRWCALFGAGCAPVSLATIQLRHS
jgi:hypothetical protein